MGIKLQKPTPDTIYLNIYRPETPSSEFVITSQSPIYALRPSYDNAIKLGRTRGTELARLVAEMLVQKTSANEQTDIEILSNMGFESTHRFEDEDQMEIAVYEKHISATRDKLSLFLSRKYIDLDYERTKPKLVLNILHIQRLNFPDLRPEQSYAPFIESPRRINLSLANLLRIVEYTAGLIQTNGPP